MLPDYMEKQPDISEDMRAILVDWMVEVQVCGLGEGAWQPPFCLWCVGPSYDGRGSCERHQCGPDLPASPRLPSPSLAPWAPLAPVREPGGAGHA